MGKSGYAKKNKSNENSSQGIRSKQNTAMKNCKKRSDVLLASSLDDDFTPTVEVSFDETEESCVLSGTAFLIGIVLALASMSFHDRGLLWGSVFPSYDQRGHSIWFVDASARIGPNLCPDGSTWGYADWNRLREAVHGMNDQHNSASAYNQGHLSYFVLDEEGVVVPQPPPPPPEPFIICPGVTLRGKDQPIYVNSEDVIVKCERCTVDVDGTHFSFGPHAVGAKFIGITFRRRPRSTSLTFHRDGADATFEECRWIGRGNSAESSTSLPAGRATRSFRPGSPPYMGAVADVNSTSSVYFSRCEINAT